MKTNNLFSAVKDKLFNKSNLTEMKYPENSKIENLQINSQTNSKIMRTLKNNLVLAAALFIAVGTMSFKMIEKMKTQTLVTLHFNGDPTDEDQVKDQTRWGENNPDLMCDEGENEACSMKVNPSDLKIQAGQRVLDDTKIILIATPTSLGFIPEKDDDNSASTNQIFPENKN